MILHGFSQPPFWIALAGFIVATWIWLFNPRIADKAENALRPLHAVLANKYWFDNLYQAVFARGGIRFGRGLWRGSDATLIDGAINGSASLVDQVSALLRRLQSGYLYHYAFAMILGLILLLGGSWWVLTRIAA
jgi:NADH-quinone oxidoreductase subunit L